MPPTTSAPESGNTNVSGASETLAGAERYDAAECARLNDLSRLGQLPSGRMVITRGCLDALGDAGNPLAEFIVGLQIRKKLAGATFAAGDDPYGERDFGSFELAGQKALWKIDYYDPSLTFGSEDPTDTADTVRVLTVMLASEY